MSTITSNQLIWLTRPLHWHCPTFQTHTSNQVIPAQAATTHTNSNIFLPVQIVSSFHCFQILFQSWLLWFIRYNYLFWWTTGRHYVLVFLTHQNNIPLPGARHFDYRQFDYDTSTAVVQVTVAETHQLDYKYVSPTTEASVGLHVYFRLQITSDRENYCIKSHKKWHVPIH